MATKYEKRTNIRKQTWLSDSAYRSIYRRVPRLCVDFVIRDQRGIVLSQRDIPPAKGKWHFPGGRVRMQERLEDALKRICREETGMKVKIEKGIGVIEYLRLGGWGHSVSVIYLVRPVGGKLYGSVQARNISFFKSLPEHTMHEVKDFLIKNRLIRK